MSYQDASPAEVAPLLARARTLVRAAQGHSIITPDAERGIQAGVAAALEAGRLAWQAGYDEGIATAQSEWP